MAKRPLRPGALLSPLPTALVTCGDREEYNVLTIAWTGIACTNPPMTYISVRPQRHSYGLLRKTGEFVLHPAPAALARVADYCGTFTGAKVNKFEKCGLTIEPGLEVAAPRIAECPIAIECRVKQVIPLGSHDLFLAEIVSVSAEDALFDAAGKLHMERAALCAYVHGEYRELGRAVGRFGFSAVRKKKGKHRGQAKD